MKLAQLMKSSITRFDSMTYRSFTLSAVLLGFLISTCAPAQSVARKAAAKSGSSAASDLVAQQAEEHNQATSTGLDIRLPLQAKSVRFAVIGDSGTGDREQYDVAREMETYWQAVKFDFVIMLGDNIYGSHSPRDFVKKFEKPYAALLNGGVKFYASLGNHDDPNDERLYKPFNMGGQRYYAFRKGDVAFFALDSNYMDPKQLEWVDQTLKNSAGKWKICFFHHPLYNDGRHHGADVDLRSQLLPLFERYSVDAVFSGHEHVYERMKPENNIYYFVLGNSGKLMTHDLRQGEHIKGFDTDRTFMIVEVTADKLYFQTISRTGETIDSGALPKLTQSH
ncbi:MAG TPA: metallophosphoesterase [Candidatus Angelobacter sp.]|nr:metallophosphoesterase [Candidatus Angelobacter sp.]